MGDQVEVARRLGKRELGPHAFEQRMPERIAALLHAESSQNKLIGAVAALANLIRRDRSVKTVYLCDDETTQIYKLKGEGNHFCGYRNIQMLLSHEQYTIPKLQDMIELAWDQGYNSHGRVETGGIKGTRKHIGTSEAEALFRSLNKPCTGKVFSSKRAWHDILDTVEDYFASSATPTADHVHETKLAPIYLQGPHHSITIIGIEILKHGKRRLLVFDPGQHPPSAMKKTSAPSEISARLILCQYKRGEMYLKRHSNYEMLYLERNV